MSLIAGSVVGLRGSCLIRQRLGLFRSAGTTTRQGAWGVAGAAAAGVCGATLMGAGVHCSSRSGIAYSFGANIGGQLGQGDVQNRGTPTPIEVLEGEEIVQVATAGRSSVALSADGRIFTFGEGSDGQLGLGFRRGETVPVEVELTEDGTPVGSLGIRQVACADKHMAAVTLKGELYTWGEGTACGFVGGRMQLRPRLVSIDSVKAVSCGLFHTAAVTTNGELYTWGDGGSRQLGQTGGGSFSKPTKVERLTNVEDVRCGRDFTVVLTKDHQLYSFGCNDDRQLGVVGTDRYQGTAIPIKTLKTKGIVQIAAGEKHAAALGADGSMYMWGHNKDGQLGNDSNMDSGKPVLVEQFRDAGLKVQSIACGSGHTSAITTDGALWVWGRGRAGQLGRGDQVESMAFYRRTPVRVDALNTHTVVGVALGGDHTLVIAYKK